MDRNDLKLLAVAAICVGLAIGLPGASPDAGIALSDKDVRIECDAALREVRIVDRASTKVIHRIRLGTEPAAAALTGEDSILIAEHVPYARSDQPYCAATVKWTEVSTGEVLKEFHLPNGSTAVKGICVSPDGKIAAVTHVIGQFTRPTVHLRVDWMAGNALTLIDLKRSEVFGSVLLDDRGAGGANPWGLDFTADGKTLVVAHSGTHEVSVIDFGSLVQAIMNLPAPVDPGLQQAGVLSPESVAMGSYTPFFPGKRHRVKLPEGDLGPREVAVISSSAFVTNYFSKTVSVVDLAGPIPKSSTLTPKDSERPGSTRSRQAVVDRMRPEEKGEFYFNDASVCFRGMQSCASCHPGQGRQDGLNWDLLNDGKGNPKNTKSLLLCFETPPAMSLGVRESARHAVEAGLKHILFAEVSRDVVDALSAYISSLKPVASPFLVEGKLSPMALRGSNVFTRAGCGACHPGPLFTDLKSYDVGTRGKHDKPADLFDTPTLVEAWRTAPYLHDGSAASIRDVVTLRNADDKHGNTSTLTEGEIADLCAYVLSL